jgi:hypothetical protein
METEDRRELGAKMKKRFQMDMSTRFALLKEMESVLEKVADRLVAYKDGHSDSSLSERFAVPVSAVHNARSEVFGHVRRINESEGRLTAIESRIKSLEEQVINILQREQGAFASECGREVATGDRPGSAEQGQRENGR